MNACEQIGDLLDGYHDGELRWWRRRRVERHLQLCTDCRAELVEIGRVGQWVRTVADTGEAPDVWAEVAPRLAALDSPRPVADRSPVSRGWSWLLGPRILTPILGGALAATAAVLILGEVVLQDPASAASVVQSIYSYEKPVMVLEGNGDEATIIWIMDPGTERSGEVSHFVRT